MRAIVRRFGAETAQGTEIHWVPAGRAAPETLAGVPFVHAAWNGSYFLRIERTSPLKLEVEVFVALKAGHVLSTRGRRDAGACLLSVYFSPDLLSAALEALSPDDRELLLAYSQDGLLRLFQHLRDSGRSLASLMQ